MTARNEHLMMAIRDITAMVPGTAVDLSNAYRAIRSILEAADDRAIFEQFERLKGDIIKLLATWDER